MPRATQFVPFSGSEKFHVITLTTMCETKGCYKDITPGTEFVQTSTGRRAHPVCATKEIVRMRTTV